ncbi:glucose-6-phosphate isomerase [Spirochaeta africana]|uniref:Glucose-6-phosphate isomerase n=1 Tax=Spirochaeta africana (strain ATCC 700263 / DSM 8902 / Z-7692) TaxID=889378 RepID=H9UFK6_SPIAZ|nr:glucose-6-phosphate isomerase [Spirochaeta africana]AFG36299.1 glucose-6-phosphate isomerase [Spirochaeta africana DSM 8902]
MEPTKEEMALTGDRTYQNLDAAPAYAELKNAARVSLKDVLNPDRVAACQVGTSAGLQYNYAAKPVSDHILDLLQQLSEQQELIPKYWDILSGETMNPGENRKVLHHLTRGQLAADVLHNERNLRDFYAEQQRRIAGFAEQVHAGTILGSTGKPFDTVVQVGIGGSDLGPRAMYLALDTLLQNDPAYAGGTRSGTTGGRKMRAEFISNVDPDDAVAVLSRIDPETTLFILVSKSGTTQETLTNEAFVIDALAKSPAQGLKPRKHMICVTSETSPLAASDEYLDSFFIDDFIGGRYSSTSAVGGALLSLAFGPDIFAEFLAGAAEADTAAIEPDIRKNAALLDALIGVYERNVLELPATAVLPYSQALSRFPAHLQQLDMESNGKQVNRDGEPVAYPTGPVIFGEPGTNGQHSFYQLLHQGTDIVPLQFIGFTGCQGATDLQFQSSTSQAKLNANMVAQIAAFALGQSDSNPNKNFPGERPSSLLFADKLTPKVLGALLAHYENKVMFQGLVWNLNSFDQEGVQLGKVLTKQVLGGADMHPALAAFAKLMEI